MKYAIIAISGSQFKVEEGQTITIGKIDGKNEDQLSTDQVLLVVNDDQTTIGQPIIKSATVEYQIVNSYQGKKLDISKYKAKSRYRRQMGFRPQLTDIKISKINL